MAYSLSGLIISSIIRIRGARGNFLLLIVANALLPSVHNYISEIPI